MNVPILVRVPKELRDWLNRRAKIEMVSAVSLIRRLLRNYVRQVDAAAYKKIERALTGADKEEHNGGTEQSTSDR